MRVPIRSQLVAAVAAATVLAGLVAAAVPAGAGPTGAAADASAAAPVAIRLLTGDTVVRSSAPGRPTAVQVRPLVAAGARGRFAQWALGGHVYVVPASAQPYLGQVLDPALFDAASAPATGAQLAVDLAYPAGTTLAVPGFTAVSSTATTAHGYFDAAGSAAFGAALAAQYARDAGAASAPTSLFGVTRIAASPAVAGADGAQPAFPQITLVIRAIGADGAPVSFGDVGIVNLDDPLRFVRFVFVLGGEARISLPKGNYGLVSDLSSFDAATGVSSDAIVSVPQVAVIHDLQRIVLDASTATAVPTVSTPQPAGVLSQTVDYERLVDGQQALGFTLLSSGGGQVAVAPAPAPRIGKVELLTSWTLVATPPRGAPFRYDVSFEDSGAIDADQHHVVATSELATLDSTYGSDGYPGTALLGRTAVYPFQAFLFFLLTPQAAPLAQTEYLGAPSGTAWLSQYIADANTFDGFVVDGDRSYPPGSRQRVDWLRGPLAPGVVGPTPAQTDFISTSCRTSGGVVSLALAGFTDSTPGHAGYVSSLDPTASAATFTLRRDGTLVARRTGTGGYVAVPPEAATYVATVETFNLLGGFSTSTHAVTTLTFRSAAGAGAPLPDGWECLASNRAVTTDATVLPVLSATVPLPTDVAGVMPQWANTFTFTVAPTPGAADATVTGATMAVSTDAGLTFTEVPVTALGGNRFRATITHTAADAGKSVSWRLAAATAGGSEISESVDHAYTVAGS